MHSTSRRRSTGHVIENDADAERIARFEETVRRAHRDGRVLILTCPINATERAAERLCSTFELAPVSLDRLLIDAMRAQASKAKADWSIVLKADRAAVDAADWRNLQALVLRAMPSVRQTLQDNPTPILLQHAGLLVRYQQIGLLQELRNQATDGRRPARLLLIPGDDGQPPMLDGVVLPVITPTDWVAVPSLWVATRELAAAG